MCAFKHNSALMSAFSSDSQARAKMILRTLILGSLPLLAAASQPASPAMTPASPPAYADLADLALAAPVAAHVRLRRAMPLRPEESAGVAPGQSRFYMEADVVALIRGAPGTPARIKYLADLPLQANGRPQRPARRGEYLIFARPVLGRPEELQLVAPTAQLPFNVATAERTRAIVREALATDAPAAISGIGRAFHVPGVLQGASETQFFLLTAANQPISLTVLRAPGEQPRWFVSTSEFVDAGATQPARDSLLWYRLACFLPAQLPPASMSETPQHAAAIAADYRLIREGLGACGRTRR
jgi:hypothetical protein